MDKKALFIINKDLYTGLSADVFGNFISNGTYFFMFFDQFFKLDSEFFWGGLAMRKPN